MVIALLIFLPMTARTPHRRNTRLPGWASWGAIAATLALFFSAAIFDFDPSEVFQSVFLLVSLLYLSMTARALHALHRQNTRRPGWAGWGTIAAMLAFFSLAVLFVFAPNEVFQSLFLPLAGVLLGAWFLASLVAIVFFLLALLLR